MKLIRPFDNSNETIAILEDENWIFEVIVSPDIADLKMFELFHVDVPTIDKDAKKTATIVVNEKWLLEICEKITESPEFAEQFEERGDPETYMDGEDEMLIITVMRVRRRAVSIALETLMDYAEAFILDQLIEGGSEYDD